MGETGLRSMKVLHDKNLIVQAGHPIPDLLLNKKRVHLYDGWFVHWLAFLDSILQHSQQATTSPYGFHLEMCNCLSTLFFTGFQGSRITVYKEKVKVKEIRAEQNKTEKAHDY